MHGTESFVSATVTDQFKVRFDYTTTRTRDEETDLGLLRRPGNKASVTAVWTPLNELTIAATLVHVSSWVDVNRDTAVFIPRLDAPAYTTFNLAANYIVNKNVTAFARADNLFNEHYQNPVGFLRPGLGVYAGLRVNN
jgi:vitamin B12 transporter